MVTVQQGDILNVSGIAYPALVVSNNFFNTSGKVIVCPILSAAEEGPLHIKIAAGPVSGFALCEQVRYLDLGARHFSQSAQADYFTVMDISDAVMGMFDYQE